jgi:hypothetical protein
MNIPDEPGLVQSQSGNLQRGYGGLWPGAAIAACNTIEDEPAADVYGRQTKLECAVRKTSEAVHCYKSEGLADRLARRLNRLIAHVAHPRVVALPTFRQRYCNRRSGLRRRYDLSMGKLCLKRWPRTAMTIHLASVKMRHEEP